MVLNRVLRDQYRLSDLDARLPRFEFGHHHVDLLIVGIASMTGLTDCFAVDSGLHFDLSLLDHMIQVPRSPNLFGYTSQHLRHNRRTFLQLNTAGTSNYERLTVPEEVTEHITFLWGTRWQDIGLCLVIVA